MKKSELRQLIKEEISKVLKEENKIPGANINVMGDYVEVNADSGDYTGDIEDDGTISFSVIYDEDELEEKGYSEFDEDNWQDILGPNHFFVQLYNAMGGEIEAIDDYVMIKVDSDKFMNLVKPKS
jgi:hypothetical protein